MLNAYQARWQYFADFLGLGFAQGKTLFWRKSDLESAGFKVVVIRRTGSGGQSGTVVEQQPAAGTTVPTDEYVAIYVAQ